MEEEVHPNGEDSLSEDDDIAFLAPQRIMAERMGSTSTMFCQQNAMKSALPSSDDATRSSNATASAASPTIKSEVGLATSTECMELEALFALPREVVEQRDPAPLPVCASLLRRYFRLSSGEFRPRQQEVCLSVLQGRRTLALCPTGWGKSVCYQFPMLVHRLLLEARCAEWRRIHAANEARALPTTADFTSKFCVVVSPLLSLMADQSEKVSTIDCLHAVVLSSQTSADRQADILRQLSCPLTAIDVVFISPERFVGDVAVRSTMEKQVHRIAFVCIDEVHCVSRWAFDFRPSFMYLHRVLVGVSFLCLTATATERVVADLQSIFCIDHTVVCIDQLRRNLHLESIDMVARSATFMGRGGPPAQRVLHDAVVSSAKELQKPMIIYVSSRADADEITSLLLTKMGSTSDTQPQQQTSSSASATDVGKEETYSGCFTTASAKALLSSASTSPRPSHKVKVGCYHAGLLRSTRSHTQQQFLRGQLDILVATVAFGMGVDKSNIRSVLHANAPSSLEGYVQEIGRAGRDGGNSVCRLLFNPYDYFALRSRALSALLSPDELYEVVHAILSSPRTQVGMPMMLVSTANIATELVLSEEAVETVIFMLLTGVEATTTPLDALWGSVTLGMRVSAPSTATPQADARPAKKRRRLAQDQGSGMHSVLEQLCVVDEVKEYCLRQTTIQNQVEAANALRLSWTGFRERVDDLQQSGALHVSRRGSAYLISLRQHVDVRSERLQRELSATLASTYMERIQNQVEALGRMFGVLAHPSHERLQSTLNGEALPSEWVPPPRALTKMEAVAMANDFVEKNRVRIHSTYEVARALLGVMPKSLIKHGKYAGELPLSHRWYVSDPMFGSLREFPLEWVLAILAPHKLDSQPESSS